MTYYSYIPKNNKFVICENDENNNNVREMGEISDEKDAQFVCDSMNFMTGFQLAKSGAME